MSKQDRLQRRYDMAVERVYRDTTPWGEYDMDATVPVPLARYDGDQDAARADAYRGITGALPQADVSPGVPGRWHGHRVLKLAVKAPAMSRAGVLAFLAVADRYGVIQCNTR